MNKFFLTRYYGARNLKYKGFKQILLKKTPAQQKVEKSDSCISHNNLSF